MNWKRHILAVMAFLAAVAFAQGGIETIVSADLSRKTYTGVSWTWTAFSDAAVRLVVQKDGADFPTAGWGGTLFAGDGSLGCAIPGVARGYNELLFDVGRGLMPTNGRYAVQIIATNTAGRVEEWARGTLTVRANPSAEGMPTNWCLYAQIAAKVAPFIDAEGILTSPENADALWGSVSNRTDALIQAVSPKPDFTTGNETLVETIGAVAPPPADYGTVKERAMSAVQTLRPSTNYTDSALGAFATTGAVARATCYGTPTRWTDATGCVWEVSVGWRIYTNGIVAVGWTAWSRAVDTGPFGTAFDLVVGMYENEENPRVANAIFQEGVAPHWGNEYEAVFDWDYDFYGLTQGDTIRAARDETNLVGRVALTADIQPATNALAWRVVEINTMLNDLRFVTNGMIKAEVVGAYIGAGTNGWPEGAAMFVRATLAEPIGSQSGNIRLVGRDSWPTNDFQSVWWRSGTNVWVSVLVEE